MQDPSPSVTYASIIVNITNNSGQGAIVFGTLDFLTAGGGYDPTTYPPIVTNTVQDGEASVAVLTATAESKISYVPIPGGGYMNEQDANPVTQGSATFWLPNGDALEIDWDLNAAVDNGNVPSITPSSNYYGISGIGNPTVNGPNYIFNIVVGPPQN